MGHRPWYQTENTIRAESPFHPHTMATPPLHRRSACEKARDGIVCGDGLVDGVGDGDISTFKNNELMYFTKFDSFTY